MKIYKVDEILSELRGCIAREKPFSMIRFGDGGLKFIDALVRGDDEHLQMISEKEGLPVNKTPDILELWGHYARRANFIDCPEIYFTDKFWPRIKRLNKEISNETKKLLVNWRDLYSRAEFDNERYCNPETNYLMTIDRRVIRGASTIMDVMRNRRVCFITARRELFERFYRYKVDVSIYPIVAQYENHYEICFEETMKYISSMAPNYDLWIVAAGELGRIYTGFIKECGGRAVDIGFVADFWAGDALHDRLCHFMFRSADPLQTLLTEEGRKYLRYL